MNRITAFMSIVLLFAVWSTAALEEIDWNAENITIKTAAQLREFAEVVNGGKNFQGQVITLGNDIMLQADTSGWTNWDTTPPDGPEWTAINGFRGTFDGAGFVIGGVYVNNTSSSKGLFALNRGTVKNLGVVASYIRGGYYAGILVGANAGPIVNCYAVGNVVGINSLGGLVGENSGTIENSHAEASVTGSNTIGGLTGSNIDYGAIKNSYANGVVKGSGNNIGGLAGINGGNSNRATIEKSYAAGNVEGNFYVGGLVGSNPLLGRIEESYATGRVEGGWEVGGLIGRNNGTAKNCYATGDIVGSRYRGGLVGDNGSNGKIENCYAAGSVTERIVEGQESINGFYGGFAGRSLGEIVNSYFDSDVYTDEHNDAGSPKSSSQMKDTKTYENWDFTSIWDINNETNDGYPFLRWFFTFVAVENISDIPDFAVYGEPLILNGIVSPENASFKNIVWSTVAEGSAEINANQIVFNTVGNVEIKATITGGSSLTEDYTEIFTFTVGKASINLDAPTLDTKTSSSITINEVTLTNGQEVKYAISINNEAPLDEAVWQTELTFSNLDEEAVYYIFARVMENTNYKTVISEPLEIATEVSILTKDRIIPPAKPGMESQAVSSVNVLTGELAAGPNPVSKQSGGVNFFWQGGRIQNALLTVFDASGNAVNKKVSIKDEAFDTQVRRKVGSWDFKDMKGRLVSDGTYLVRGVIIVDGKKEKVSVIIGLW